MLLTIINHILTIINSILTIRVGLNHQPVYIYVIYSRVDQSFDLKKMAPFDTHAHYTSPNIHI